MPSIYKHLSRPFPKTPKHASATHVTYVDPLEALTDDEDDEIDPGEYKERKRRPWRPVTFHLAFLALMCAVTAALIGAVARLLWISNRDQGLIFAQDVNKLPLSRSFSYLYLPTIISVLYSLLWAWIDLDIKRLEPYFQISKSGGANGCSSVLLAYPLEFLLTLPFLAYKHRHWMVVSGSVVTMLVLWGLTPIQAGIFASRTITVRNDLWGYRSESFISIADQGNLSAVYAQSVYNIAWLNETLPSLMTKEYVLGAFNPLASEEIDFASMTYTGPTFAYSVDISCSDVVLWKGDLGTYYNSTNGCSFYAPPYRPMDGNDTSKIFDTMYVGYQNQNGLADYYLSSSCDERSLNSFFIRWSKTTPAMIFSGNLTGSPDLAMANETSLFCKPTYYRQLVNATVSMPNKTVLHSVPIREKTTLPKDMFNNTQFEWMMSAGSELEVRGEYPTTTFPNQKTHLMNTELNLAYLPKMAPFAIATYQRPFDEYLDPETLRIAYQSAYRLLFARQLVDILQDYRNSSVGETVNQREYIIQAVIIVPGFAYATIAILALVLLLALGLLFKLPSRPSRLICDPSTVGAVMDLIDEDNKTVETFSDLAEVDIETLDKCLANTNFELTRSPENPAAAYFLRTRAESPQEQREMTQDQAERRGVRPYEFKAITGAIFFIFQLATLVTFLALFVKSRKEHGLRLPSQSTFVRQLVQNYIPIAVGTFIEPFWLLLNRLICLLQPYEHLRAGGASAARSIDLDYSSLPPQFLFWRAACARHWIIVLVCLMVLAANVLSVALSGLMYEGLESVPSDADLSIPRGARFVSLNGTGLPFNTDDAANWQGGTTSDQFYSLMSNLTAGTPLPPWVDEEYAYLAIDTSNADTSSDIHLRTIAVGTSMDCRPLDTINLEQYTLKIWNDAKFASLDVQINQDGSQFRCTDSQSPSSNVGGFQIMETQTGHVAFEFSTMLTNNRSEAEDLFCRQHVLVGWVRADWAFNDTEEYRSGSPYGIHNTSRNETVMLCRPTLQIGSAEVVADSTGRIKHRKSFELDRNGIESYFSSSHWDLIAQVHQFLPDVGTTWHKDAYPSDFINYLITKSTNDTTLLDWSLPPPPYDLANKHFSAIYRRLFAILIGSNQDLLFEELSEPQIVTGQIFTPETRILFSLPAFVVVEGILLCYIIVTIIFYARRPWKVLPRLPSSIASNIAFFAASRAFHELKDEVAATGKYEDGRRLRTEWKWGYGSFIGLDGRPRVGIEREPLVSVFKEEKPPAYTP